MARTCTVCAHPERDAIDEALATGSGPLRTIADRFGVSKTALIRHKGEHLPERLARAQEAEEVASAGLLLEQMQSLQIKTLEILGAATDQRTALQAVSQARQNVGLLAELTGKLAHQPVVNVLVSQEWVTVRSALLNALGPFPDARAAVANRLLTLGNGGGR